MNSRILMTMPAVLLVVSCGGAVDPDALPATDEATCVRGTIEADGRDSSPLELPKGQYVISTTYLRLKNSRTTLQQFTALSTPMEAALRRNPGRVKSVTRLSESCNTARTLTVWKDEASMYEFVASPEHAAAMAAVLEVSRGGSIVTHWNDTEAGFTWQKAGASIAADTGPFY
jgi:quinol monooxygenase YgiN